MKVKLLSGIALLTAVVFAAQAQMTDEEIADRIKPHGKVTVAGAEAESAAAAGGAKSGADIYNQACVACHGAGVLGAPKLQDAADWQPRLDEKGLDTVVLNAINGINAMPPMGTCGSCSNDDIKAAVEYMIEGI